MQQSIIASIGKLKQEKTKISNRVSSCLAGALVLSQTRIEKMNPIIRPFMDILKTERCFSLQNLTALWLCSLLDILKSRSPSPVAKVVKNICLLCGSSPYGVPVYQQHYVTSHQPGSKPLSDLNTFEISCTWKDGILCLLSSPAKTEVKTKDESKEMLKIPLMGFSFEPEDMEMKTQFFGIQKAIKQLAEFYGANLFDTLPELWSQLSTAFSSIKSTSTLQEFDNSMTPTVQQWLSVLQVFQTLCFCIHHELSKKLLSFLPMLKDLLGHELTVVRHMISRCFACMIAVDLNETMNFIVVNILSSLDMLSNQFKQGFIETIYFIAERFSNIILDFSVMFIMPVLGCMSSQDSHIRLLASLCFAQLIPLAALQVQTEHVELPHHLLSKVEESQLFIEQLLDISKLQDFVVPVPIKAELRKYQQDGVNWLAFLNRYKLHGILCDDMGLGKTLQCICIIASDHSQKRNEKCSSHQPSIVVCPPTLTGHWCYEVSKFCENNCLSVLQYSGNPGERLRMQTRVHQYDLVISSYEVVRNDIAFFRSISWNYCVLDEGHIIKNPKAKITKSTKELQSNYRLILTGTPIQNNAVDLWSLFDFLMPGYLGTQRQFHDRFGKPILASRDAKASSKEQEEGALALEALHKQVLPFMLRRMKDDVLQDLPPKIIQDYYCNFSPIQVVLYESISKDMVKSEQEMPQTELKGGSTSQHPHIFQSLQYLKKVCNHPKLMLDKDKYPKQWKLWEEHKLPQDTIDDICHSAKLTALKQLLCDCGFNCGPDSEDSPNALAVSQHRALIFCQLKHMIDIIEQDLLRKHCPAISYLRMDGSTPPKSRQSLVQRYNDDPSIDLLLLTTQVGGLGLNLTGADTVIFFEHDWNPTKDLQAMDRCHRIGQKKVVNVYRLITVGTLEEKIMNLQKFKLSLASTVVSQDNSSLASMDTSSLLDLFQFEGQEGKSKKSSKQQKDGSDLNSVLQELSDLWEEDDYRSEYDVDLYSKT
jgi:TATA-binding protein-associated factor